MKARVLFGVFGFAFVLLALYVFPPIVLELVVAALCVFATYEVLGSTKLVRNHLELMLAMAVSLGLAVGHFSILPLRLESVMQGLVDVYKRQEHEKFNLLHVVTLHIKSKS